MLMIMIIMIMVIIMIVILTTCLVSFVVVIRPEGRVCPLEPLDRS